MKLWEITNGFVGCSYVRCLVIAETQAEAIEEARVEFQADGQEVGYSSNYWMRLTPHLLCDDTTKPWAGKVSDE